MCSVLDSEQKSYNDIFFICYRVLASKSDLKTLLAIRFLFQRHGL